MLRELKSVTFPFYASFHPVTFARDGVENKQMQSDRMRQLCFVIKIRQPLNLLKPTGYVMNQKFNIQQLYALPTLYLCVLYLSENKRRLVPLTS